MECQLTVDQARVAIDSVWSTGRARQRIFGRKFNEVDYFCGAMAVFEALGCFDQVPAVWIIAPMYGRSALDWDAKEDTEQ